MKNYFKTQIFSTPYELANMLCMDFIRYTENMLRYREKLYIALSGGSTPQLMFEVMVKEYSTAIPWNKLHFFWVDERCVLQSDKESNYGNAYRILFSNVSIPVENLHPIQGGEDPITEVVRYTGEILAHVPCVGNIPAFDLIMLGMGDDGHTASIFPGQLKLFETNTVCSVSQHPQTFQKRITLTGKVINNASDVLFVVTGSNKAEKVRSILNDEAGASLYPAYHVQPMNGSVAWYLDMQASKFIQLKK